MQARLPETLADRGCQTDLPRLDPTFLHGVVDPPVSDLRQPEDVRERLVVRVLEDICDILLDEFRRFLRSSTFDLPIAAHRETFRYHPIADDEGTVFTHKPTVIGGVA